MNRLQSFGVRLALGVRLAVDDAGSGYASFRDIVRLAPDVIEVDRALIEDVDRDHGRPRSYVR